MADHPGRGLRPAPHCSPGKIDLGRGRAHWPDLLRLVGSIHTSAVSAHDVLRMLQHGGSPTELGEALAHYGRIFKILHLSHVDQAPYRSPIKGMRNLQERRHACDTSSTAAAVISGRPTNRAWRTSSGHSGWS